MPAKKQRCRGFDVITTEKLKLHPKKKREARLYISRLSYRTVLLERNSDCYAKGGVLGYEYHSSSVYKRRPRELNN